jgi:RNA polymerase sigma factor (sigma-70 family)
MIDYYNDTFLWLSFKKGDKKAFQIILDQYYQNLYNYGIRLSHSKDLAYDCLQDLFVELWNRKEFLETPKSIKAYLFISYKRRILKELAFNNKRSNILKEDTEIEVQFNIETYLINNEIEHETLLRLKHELRNLSKRQREVLYLRFYEELEYEEISKIMEISHHSTINLVYEALKMMRKNWVMSMILPFLIAI